MILDARLAEVPATIAADVAIVGAGAAGIALALELSAAGLTVVMTEAGGRKFSRESQDFYTAEAVDPESHDQVNLFRRRVFGGSTTVWGGRCIPFDPIDFEDRPWIAHGTWPITYEEYARYLPRALDYLQAGPPEFAAERALPGEPAPLAPGVNSPDVVLNRIERFSLPINCAAAYGDRLASSDRITVLLHAPVEAVLTEEAGVVVAGVRVRPAADIRPITVRAKYVILAAGGLEVPRLLLMSNADKPQGLGNDRDLVGRFYQCHIEGEFGAIRFTKPADQVRQDYQRSPQGVYCRRFIWLSPEAQRTHQLAGLVMRPFHSNIVDPGHRHPVLSAMYLVKNHIVPEYARKLTLQEDQKRRELGDDPVRFWSGHLRNIVLGSPRLAGFSIDWARRRVFAKRKLPSVVLKDPRETYPIEINAEQEPNRDSRVLLGQERDALGLPRLRIEWRTSEADHLRMIAGMKRVQAALNASDQVHYSLGEEDLERAMGNQVPVGGHYIGTARMAASPAEGVCDANCEVFGTKHLFLAGAAVFSTSGFANPTLTLTALALRLADHIRAVASDPQHA